MSNSADHFPQTLQQAIVYFSDPDIAVHFVSQMRWKDGVTCPYCQGKEHSFLKTRRIWKCKNCKKQFSVKVGTIFEDSPIGLDKWLAAVWMIGSAKNGVSSYEIHRALGVTQKTAWFMLHRIRLAMQTGTFEKLTGEVEVDETWIGGKVANMHKSKRPNKSEGETNKSIVVGMLQRGGKVRATVVKDTARKTLQDQVRTNVDKSAKLFTDAHPAYDGLVKEYYHDTVDHRKEFVRDEVHINGVENFWSLLKRCMKGTYIHVDEEHLFRYLDEETFRFNNRKENDASRFVDMVRSVTGKRLTYEELTDHK